MPSKNSFENHEQYLEYYRQYRFEHREKLRKYNRKYNKKWRKNNGYHNEVNSKKRYPEKVAARRLLYYAIKNKLVKKKPCEVCFSMKSQAHHDDYTKPLNVIWLCPLHHKDKHRKVKINGQ